MANPNKKQGTEWETVVERYFSIEGWEAHRLAEGGSLDPGDILLKHPTLGDVIIEARHRTNMNPFKALVAAKRKAKVYLGARNSLTFVAWKRTVAKEGNTRRSQEGPPIALLQLSDLRELLRLAAQAPPRPSEGEGRE